MRVISWIAVLALALCCGCGGEQGDEPANEPEHEREGEDREQREGDDTPSPLGKLGFLGSMLSKQLDEPGPYDEPRQSADYDADEAHHAVLELSGPIVELKSMSLLSPGRGVELRAVVDRLGELAADEQVSGLLLRVSELGVDMATAEELRAALVAFKGEGERSLRCHIERASTLTYYVLSACDSIGLAPSGEIAVTGVAAVPVHIKGLLDQLHIEADFLHIGAYKGAAEPLTRERPSDELRQTLDAILDRAYQTLVAGIAEGRELDPDRVRALIDTALFMGEDAVSAGLVDGVAVYEAYRDEVAGPWVVVDMDKKKAGMGELMRLLGVMPPARPWQPHVALVHAVGLIVDGKGQGKLGARQEIASRRLAAALRALAADDKVKAMVLRIDSGGGSALASEIIWAAVAEAKEHKPVVVSMAGMAASGGYYIACGATKIFALDNTLTGSIGVVGGKLALGQALGSIGVETYPMGRGKRALLTSALDRWSADEREAMQGMMESIYRTFVNRVASGRGQSYEDIHAVAQGRVWTGAAARERGLVDEIGGLQAALAEARALGEVDADTPLEVYPPAPTLLDLLGSLGQVQAPAGLGAGLGRGADTTLGAMLDRLARDVGVAEARAVAGLLEQVLLLRDTRVLAAALFPAVVR